MARLDYDTSTVSPEDNRALWNPGRYAVEIVRSDVKPTKSGSGEYVEVEFRTEEGRPFWSRYNVKNENADAERIGRSQFAALHHAAGLPKLDDTDQLLGRRVVLEIGVKKRRDTGEDENVVRGYFSATTPTATPVAPPKAATGGTTVPPWAAGKAA